MIDNKLYPGMICDGIEMFNHGNQLRVISRGRIIPFYELPFTIIEILKEAIKANPDAEFELNQMHPDSEMKRIEQFAICNFSGLDFIPDIKDGELQQGEYWNCPRRGCCPGEGKICKDLKFNNNKISSREIQMIKLLVTDMTNETMAGELNLALGTLHFFKKELYKKLGVSTKQEITVIAMNLNII